MVALRRRQKICEDTSRYCSVLSGIATKRNDGARPLASAVSIEFVTETASKEDKMRARTGGSAGLPSQMRRKVKLDPKWPEHPELSRVMTLREVAAYLQVHPCTIYGLLKQHKIPAFRVGGDWRFSIQAIDRWLLQQQKAYRQ